MCFACMYICACIILRGQKRASGDSGTELQVIESSRMGASFIKSGTPGRAASTLNYRAIFPPPRKCVLVAEGGTGE